MYFLRVLLTCWSLVALSTALTIDKRQNSGRLVFAHFMVGIVGDRSSAADWDADMQRAKAYGIDAFALNIGTDAYTDTQLQYAYTSAQNNGMKVFLSFDFAWWSTGSPAAVGQKVAQYANNPAQLMVDGKAFVSSFVGDGVDANAIRSAAGTPIYFAPNFSPSATANQPSIDASFNWMGWPNNGNNRAASSSSLDSVVAGDNSYISALGKRDYVAPVSPWFFTHYGPEVSYSKNWIFPADLLWFNRWAQLLTLGPRFVEIVTWNDYGESHYVGPLSSKHYDDGASKWVNDMPHDGWLDMAKPFIAAYKAGAASVSDYITGDQLVYWYRPQLKTADCAATDNTGSAPDGWQTVEDKVFVVALLKTPATIRVTSGGNVQTFEAQAGATSYAVDLGTGKQQFEIIRSGQTVLSGVSRKDVSSGCVCGLYNFNAYVGTLPATDLGSLSGDGYGAFNQGLKVSTCQPQPSLGAAAAAVTTANAVTTTKAQTTTMQAVTTTPKAVTTANKAVTTTSTPKATTAPGSNTSTCNKGTGPGNYLGLCSFACERGYCPSPCTCQGTGAPVTQPAPQSNVKGVPATGLDASYSSLCGFVCARGYCPAGACKVILNRDLCPGGACRYS